LCNYAEDINLSEDVASSVSSSGVQAVTAPPRSSEARPVMLNVQYFEAVRRLLRRPADVEQLLGLLSRLHADDWGRYFTQLQWAPFSMAMRHLQQQHTLQGGSLVNVRLGLKALLMAVMYSGSNQLHAIHSWALGRSSEALPLPLLLLLGVDVNKPWQSSMYSHKEEKLQDALGDQAPPLALALSRTVKWTTEVQQQRLEAVQALVAAGASYSWEGPDGATVLSLAAQLRDPAFLQALLARPNALQAFTPEQVSAALVAAEYICERNGCLLMQAVADYRASAAASLALTPAATAAVTDLLAWCVEEGNVSTLQSLLAAGADPNAQPSVKSNNWPVLHEVVFAACKEDRTMVRSLLCGGNPWASLVLSTCGSSTLQYSRAAAKHFRYLYDTAPYVCLCLTLADCLLLTPTQHTHSLIPSSDDCNPTHLHRQTATRACLCTHPLFHALLVMAAFRQHVFISTGRHQADAGGAAEGRC
jgi:hypothetical protein